MRLMIHKSYSGLAVLANRPHAVFVRPTNVLFPSIRPTDTDHEGPVAGRVRRGRRRANRIDRPAQLFYYIDIKY
jgi:hypothetical protein